MPTPISLLPILLTSVRKEAGKIQDIQKDQDPSLLTLLNKETGLQQGVETGPDQGVDTHDLDDQLLSEDQAHEEAYEEANEEANGEPNEEPNREVENELERQLQAELLVLSREISSNIDASNILSRRRIRKAKQDNDFVYATTIVQGIDEEELPALLYVFAAGLYAEKLNARRYRDNLLLPPKYWKDIINYPFQ